MIRPYVPSDKKVLIDIFTLNTPTYFGVDEIKDYEAFLDHEAGDYFVILHETQVVGAVGYYIKQSVGSITWIFIHPAFKCLGLAKEAVDYMIHLIKLKEEAKKIVIRTSQWANAFFEKFGFKEMHFEKDYWAPGLDLYTMEMMI